MFFFENDPAVQDRQPMHLAVPTSLCSFVKKNKK